MLNERFGVRDDAFASHPTRGIVSRWRERSFCRILYTVDHGRGRNLPKRRITSWLTMKQARPVASVKDY